MKRRGPSTEPCGTLLVTNEFLSIAKVTCIISHRKQDSIHKISKDEQLPNLCENMFACRKASFCWLQKNCTVQWVARYLHGYLEFAESLFTLDWRLHLSINEYVSYTAVKRTKFSFQWYKDLYIRWFASNLWSEDSIVPIPRVFFFFFFFSPDGIVALLVENV